MDVREPSSLVGDGSGFDVVVLFLLSFFSSLFYSSKNFNTVMISRRRDEVKGNRG